MICDVYIFTLTYKNNIGKFKETKSKLNKSHGIITIPYDNNMHAYHKQY